MNPKIFFPVLLAVVFFEGCKKDNSSTPPPAPTAKCMIKSETNGLSGNEKSFEYSFDANGNPSLVKVFNRFGNLDRTYEIGSNTVKINYTVGSKPAFTLIKYTDNDLFDDKFPSRADVSISDGDTTRVNYYSYFFFYNAKNQLTKVGEQTNFVIGDYEYDLNIYYNDQGNVKALQYEYTTGSNQVIAPITVSAYDDKPMPFAGVKGWPFLMVNFNWDNYDPEPLLTALSKNNALNYTTGTGANVFTRTMVYEYNNNGFPTLRKNTNKNANGEYTFLQTFSYNCK